MMKSGKILFAVICAVITAFSLLNFILLSSDSDDSGKPYLVEIKRLANKIENSEQIDLSECRYVVNIEEETDENFYNSDFKYAIRKINGRLFRFDYNIQQVAEPELIIFINAALGIFSAYLIFMILYVKMKILKPFEKLSELPYEISKGNLTAPVEECREKYFGRFLWGMNVLRENTEQQKQRELQLQKEKKTLLLSLSHDIKTPLSAVKLYSKALSKGLYTDTQKWLEISEKINEKADEIEGYINKIVKASNEDFLSFEVNTGDFYFADTVEALSNYYSEKLNLLRTDFEIAEYSNCLIKCDPDRLVEVLQNIVENAIKYGDGKYIKISFSEEDNFRLIHIRNSGCTLEERELNHIFESFWRGSNVGNNQGSGLGLYICRQLMIKMNGEIFAKIEGEDIIISVVVEKV